MEGNEILIPIKAPLTKKQKTGNKKIIYGIEKTEKELKNIYGPNVDEILLKHHYKQFIQNADGTYTFISDKKIEDLNIDKNMHSFKIGIFAENYKKRKNTKKIKNVVKFKKSTGQQVINIRDGSLKELKELTSNNNSYYDVERITFNLWVLVSGSEEEDTATWLHKIIRLDILKINELKNKLLIPINNLLTPSQIMNIIDLHIWGGYDNNGVRIGGFIDGFAVDDDNFILDKDTIAEVKIRNEAKIQLLTQKDNFYYLKNNIRHYKDLSNFFNAIDIPVLEGQNCVIQTLKYILKNYSLKGIKKIFKEELRIIENNFIKNKEIPTQHILFDFCEKVKINYDIRNYTDLNDKKTNNFNNEKIIHIVIYDHHLYLLNDKKEFEKIFDSISNNEIYEIYDNSKFNEELNKLLDNNIDPHILNVENSKNSKDLLKVDITSFKNKVDEKEIIYIRDDEEKTNTNLLYLCQALKMKYYSHITIYNFIDEYCRQNNIKMPKSFFPYEKSSNEILFARDIPKGEEDNFIIIDKNLCYPNIFEESDIIPIINILIDNFEKCTENELPEINYLYSVKVLKDNLFFKTSDNFFGHILNDCHIKQMVQYMIKEKFIKLIEKIKVNFVKNPLQELFLTFKKIILTTENRNNIRNIIKKIAVIFIGKFNKCLNEMIEIRKNFRLKKTEERTHINENETFYKYNEIYDIYYQTENKIRLYTMENNKPLRTYILNKNWLETYKMCNERKISHYDIYQNNTDSITLLNKKLDPRTINEDEEDEMGNNYLNQINKKTSKKNKLKYKEEDEIYYNGKYEYLIKEFEKEQEEDKFKLYGFKIEKFKRNKDSISLRQNNIIFSEEYFKPNNKIVVNFGYAGIGKSYKINKFIQQLEKENKKYLLIANQNSILSLYDNNINKKTIQKIMSNNIVPEEDIIIIDEFGLLDFSTITKIIQWSYKFNKDLYFYGDIFQLPPIDFNKKNNFVIINDIENKQPTFNIEYLKGISKEFNFYLDTDENKRNNFSIDVYKLFIENNFTIEEIKILIKTLVNDKADEQQPNFINICYTNEKRNEINNEFLQKNNQTFFKDEKTKEIIIKGLNIPLISNEEILINNTQDIICPKEFLKLNVINDKYILSYENENNKLINFEMEPHKIFNYFNVAYCVNLYSIQGQTLTNFKYCLDDKEIYFLHKNNKYNINGGLYTLLSRIKEPLINKKITIDDINDIITSKKNINNNIIKNDIKQPIILRKKRIYA